MPSRRINIIVAIFFVFAFFQTFARGKKQASAPFFGVWTRPTGAEFAQERPYGAFPSLYLTSTLAKLPDSVPERYLPGIPQPEVLDRMAIIANNQILSFYGSPLSKKMGILGTLPKDELTRLLLEYARLYDEANGPRGVIPSFYLVYGTCWPKGDIGFLPNDITEEYIQYAAERGIVVFIDHQLGKYSVPESMDRILPFLKYSNVHLALDPEWRTLKPMKEIGSISAAELNAAQQQMQDYMVANNIPGLRMLVVHQFQDKMITKVDTVKADFDRILLIHTADGFGSPALKRFSYANNAKVSNIPLKGFKLFFKSGMPGAGFDEPLLTPPEVIALDPEPVLVMYQ